MIINPYFFVPPFDPDAQAFITAASITNPTQQSAINQLVVDLKGYNIWTKMKALYPFVGGTAAQHKWNLKDPRDLDAAFRLVFSGGVTHSSTGVTFNGTNGYADTKVNDFGQLNNNNKHISMYQRNILASVSNSSMGADNLANRFFLNFSGQNYSTLGMNQSPFTVQTPQQGMFAMSKTASGSFKYFQNALTAVTKTGSDVSSLYNYFIGACSLNGNPFEYAAANIAFASIGDGLSDTDATNLNTRVTTFQTALNRNV